MAIVCVAGGGDDSTSEEESDSDFAEGGNRF